MSRVLSGVYTLGQASFRDLKKVMEAEENATMLDDQREVNIEICQRINTLFCRRFRKQLLIVSGPPGTGKTVLGLHFIYHYCRKDKKLGHTQHRCIFAMPRSRTLSQVIQGASGIAPAYLDQIDQEQNLVVVDEAHRIEHLENTLTNLFRKANIVIVLQDDRQRIRPAEEGTVEQFKRFADTRRIACKHYTLASQKRAGYLGSYVFDLDNLLYNRWD